MLELLLQAIRAKAEEASTTYGPVKPLNDAAVAEQARHCLKVDEITAKAKEVVLAQRVLSEAMKDEMILWSKNLRQAMPELEGLEDVRITDDGRGYTLPVPSGDDEAPAKVRQPEWAKLLAAEMEGGKLH